MATDLQIESGVVAGFPIALMSAGDLARAVGYSGPTTDFYKWLKVVDIKPVPGRPGKFDPKHVRVRLDAVQGLPADNPPYSEPEKVSYVEQSRARRGQ